MIGIRNPWEGKAFKDLPSADQLKINDAIIHATIFQQDNPKEVLDSIYFVFERINSGGIRLSPQEIRNCITSGPFNRMVKRLNQNPSWRNIFGQVENKRAKDQELIIRFLALSENSANYTRPMATFLNNFSAEANKFSPRKIKSLADLFTETIEFVDLAVGARAFRPVRSLNAAVFDGVMTGLAERLARNPKPLEEDIAFAYDVLIADPEFKKTWERATADEENVRLRLEIARTAFAQI